ncbi:MAG: Ig-like domain-containing protein [candidate division KSB1 bacterium]|nr:Ig-like domain-containing protein [candidate division KSB1 bacterium]MDZ7273819.1 Ig-like domain-containing protein [candidate division KSB1 bacterium]MDZ7285975.1 Ig-like domain-containing protein [candidate division KSB1 bacterium]MDZ7299007.1 Ig-like domain-containing protein [candidate division KSB1 bacterium]MDZ7349848.1 Ig-like domain-containing protein [candidate division KSB1 bacterium]
MEEFKDTFNRTGPSLGGNWDAHEAMQIQNNQLVNTSTVDQWNGFLAIAKVFTNPTVVKLVFGNRSDSLGRAFTGAAVRLSTTNYKTTKGYLVVHNGERLKLFELFDGVPQTPAIVDQAALAPPPKIGDTLRVELDSDASGHKFTVYINNTFDGILLDPNKVAGNNAVLYAGVQIHGNTNDGVDFVSLSTPSDMVPPAAITNLSVVGASSTTLTLEFTATGDDGNSGVASRYDVRYSNATITEANFTSATPANVTDQPAPAGTVQRVTVSGLSTGKSYFFALKVLDEANNASPISNVVQGSTALLSTIKDDFERAGPGLGADWAAGTNLQIVGGEVKNTSPAFGWERAVLKTRRNAQEVTMKWGPTATPEAIQHTGIFVMASSGSSTASGYLIQRENVNGGRTNLWHVKANGELEQIGGGLSQYSGLATAGSVMTVKITVAETSNIFEVTVDGHFDREFADDLKRESGSFAGFMLNGGNPTATIGEIVMAYPVKPATSLRIDSGDGQIASVGQSLPEPLVVALTDEDSNPVPGQRVDFTVSPAEMAVLSAPPSPDGNLRIEAESGNLQAPLTIRTDAAASGGKYINYPSGNSQDAKAVYTFQIQEAGTYYIWTRSLNNYGAPVSWDIKVDNLDVFIYDVFKGQVINTWTWDKLSDRGNDITRGTNPQFNPRFFEFTPGTHTIEFRVRYAEAWLDKFIITRDVNFIPEGTEDTGFVTDSEGKARAEVKLGNRAGQFFVDATHGSLPPARFTLNATGGAAARMEITATNNGNNQTGPGGQALPKPFSVTVRDANNNPVAGHQVSWVVLEGEGRLSSYTSVTDLNGVATTTLTLGSVQANHRVEARSHNASGLALAGSPVVFTATANARLAASITRVSGNNQSAQVRTRLPQPVVTKVADAGGAGVSWFSVEWEVARGGGTVSLQPTLRNPGFESFTGSLPANWTLEGAPTGNEVSLSTSSPRSGNRSLQINTSRTGVGVSQSFEYAANTNYTLSFYAKVLSGTARVVWRVNDANGNISERVIDILPSGTGNSWVKYLAAATNGQAGERALIFRSSGAANFLIDDVKITSSTDSNGELTATWTLGDTAGTQEVRARALAGSANLSGSPLAFTATAKAGPAATLAKNSPTSGDGQVGSANQPLNQPFVVKVTDVTGINVVSGVNVTFKVIAGNGKLEGGVTTLTRATGADGLAAVTLTLGPQNGATNTVEASAAGLAGSPLTFSAVAAVPARFEIAGGANQRGSAGYLTNAPLALRITDASGRAISGYPVLFEVLEGGGTINGKSTITLNTEADGVARAPFKCGPIPGALNRIKASASVNGQPVSGSPQSFSIRSQGLNRIKLESGNNQEGVVGELLAEPFKVSIRDSAGKGIANQEVTFKVTAGEGQLEGNLTQKTVKTDSSGFASMPYRLGTKPVENRVTATSNPANLQGSPMLFKAIAKVGPPEILVKAGGDSSKGVVGNPLPTPLVAQVTDKHGNGIQGIEVTFTVKSGGGNLEGQQSLKRVTNTEGKAQVTLTLGTTAGLLNNVVEAEARNGSVPLKNSPVRFRVSATASRAVTIVNNGGSGQSGRAGDLLSEFFRVRINDKDGNGVEGHPVQFSVKHGGGGFHPSGSKDTTVVTNASGVARIQYRLGGVIKPDSQLVQATANDGITGDLLGSPIKFVAYATPGRPCDGKSFVTTAASRNPADGVTPVPVTIYVRDCFGNPVKGESVIIEVTNGPNDITQPVQVTNSNGITTGSFTSTRSGEKVVTARIPSGIAITAGATVTFTPLAAQQMALRGGNNQKGNVNAAVREPLSVKISDRFGNGVPNHPVTFVVKRGNGRMFGGSPGVQVFSDEAGIARAYFIGGASPGESQVYAESANLDNSPVIFIENTEDNPARKLEYVGGNGPTGTEGQTGVAGEVLRDSIAVRVTDANGRPVFGVPVHFTIAFGGGSVNRPVVNSNVFGEAKVAWRLGDQAGLNTLRVSAEGLQGSPIDFSAYGTGGQACCLTTFGGVVNGYVGGLSDPIRVKVSDRNGNGVDGQKVTFELVEGSGSLTATESYTSNGGIASTRLNNSDNVSGFRTVRASAPGLTGSPLLLQVYVKPSAVVSMSAVPRTNNQGGTINRPLNFPLQVKLLDRYGNPTPNEAVSFVITGGGGNFNGLPSISVLSDTFGIAQTVLTLGASPGLNQAVAIKPGLSNVEFKATGYINKFPIFMDVPDLVVFENQTVEFSLRATDDDGDPISYGASNLPPGAVFDSLNTRFFTWRTDFNTHNNGPVYEPLFYARDGKGGVDIEAVRITVKNTNRPPVVISRIPDRLPDRNGMDSTVVVDSTGVARFTMRVVAEDPDGDRLHYAWEQNGVPVGSDAPSYRFVGVPVFHHVRVTISDGFDQVVENWQIKVPVVLISFSASANGGNGVKLEWRTGGESQNLGFNLLRSVTREGGYRKLNRGLIPPRPDGEYSFVDTDITAGSRYFYKLEDVDATGNVTTHGPIQIEAAVPTEFALRQNFPNPFNPSTNIQYQLPRPAQVRLVIYNALGQFVRLLVHREQPAGFHTVVWDGRDRNGNPVPSGIYHYRLEAEGFVMTKKMVLAK